LYTPNVSHKYASLHVPEGEHHSGKIWVILIDTLVPTPENFFQPIQSGGKMMVHEYNDPGCRPMSVLNLAGFLARSEVNGPGTRAVIWVQGCTRRCKGCFNPQFQPFSPASQVPVDKLAESVLSLSGIEGVTFSGGEPFLQAGPLAALGEQLRNAGLTIVTYTGFTTAQIAKGDDPSWPALLAVTDLLISGPYIETCAGPDPLKGSSNQQVIPLGTKLQCTNHTRIAKTGWTSMEFSITPEGTITTTGFPTPDFVDKIASRCKEG
jgi:anaerobic ribonucleoside-triphosphate reductase activating protein